MAMGSVSFQRERGNTSAGSCGAFEEARQTVAMTTAAAADTTARGLILAAEIIGPGMIGSP